MKIILKILIIASIIIIFGVGIWIIYSKNSNKVELRENQQEFKTRVDQEFFIIMNSNASTGYSWQFVKPLDENILKLLETNYIPSKSNRIGAPGKQIWNLKAITKGETTISLEYVRSWEKNVSRIETRNLKVIVN